MRDDLHKQLNADVETYIVKRDLDESKFKKKLQINYPEQFTLKKQVQKDQNERKILFCHRGVISETKPPILKSRRIHRSGG